MMLTEAQRQAIENTSLPFDVPYIEQDIRRLLASDRAREYEVERLHARINELCAARYAYASEFDGDQGSIHSNIRELKQKAEAAERRCAELVRRIGALRAVMADVSASLAFSELCDLLCNALKADEAAEDG